MAISGKPGLENPNPGWRGFPVFLNVSGSMPLVIGDGGLAASKVHLLLMRAPAVRMAASQVPASLTEASALGRVIRVEREQISDYMAAAPLVIAADEDREENRRLSERARALRVPVNVPDCPDLSTFSLGAIVDRDPVTVMVGTDGAAPLLSAQLREMLETSLSPGLGKLASFGGRWRKRVSEFNFSPPALRGFWRRFFSGEVATALMSDDEAAGQRHAERLIGETIQGRNSPESRGRVILVGAGPGDPELLTLAAVRALKDADVIFYDRLPGEAVLSVARREAIRIPVGKQKGSRLLAQSEIHRQMIERALRGELVVRLKGGDPTIFGRAGEEIEALHSSDISVSIVPGITAATAAAAAVGLSLTHRDLARSVTFISGHAPDTGDADFGGMDLKALALGKHTLAVYMGASRMQVLCQNLVAAGWPATTPILVLISVSQSNERRVVSDVGTLLQHSIRNIGSSPALILVGDVLSQSRQGSVERHRASSSSMIDSQIPVLESVG